MPGYLFLSKLLSEWFYTLTIINTLISKFDLLSDVLILRNFIYIISPPWDPHILTKKYLLSIYMKQLHKWWKCLKASFSYKRSWMLLYLLVVILKTLSPDDNNNFFSELSFFSHYIFSTVKKAIQCSNYLAFTFTFAEKVESEFIVILKIITEIWRRSSLVFIWLTYHCHHKVNWTHFMWIDFM